MSGVSGIGLLTSFGAGVILFLSPCVLPLAPRPRLPFAWLRQAGRIGRAVSGLPAWVNRLI